MISLIKVDKFYMLSWKTDIVLFLIVEVLCLIPVIIVELELNSIIFHIVCELSEELSSIEDISFAASWWHSIYGCWANIFCTFFCGPVDWQIGLYEISEIRLHTLKPIKSNDSKQLTAVFLYWKSLAVNLSKGIDAIAALGSSRLKAL